MPRPQHTRRPPPVLRLLYAHRPPFVVLSWCSILNASDTNLPVREECLFDAEQDSGVAGDGECLARRLLKGGWLEMQFAGGYAR